MIKMKFKKLTYKKLGIINIVALLIVWSGFNLYYSIFSWSISFDGPHYYALNETLFARLILPILIYGFLLMLFLHNLFIAKFCRKNENKEISKIFIFISIALFYYFLYWFMNNTGFLTTPYKLTLLLNILDILAYISIFICNFILIFKKSFKVSIDNEKVLKRTNFLCLLSTIILIVILLTHLYCNFY